MKTDEITWIYGWGRTKHIARMVHLNPGTVGLCGAEGGHSEEPKRPVCKHCTRLAELPPPEWEIIDQGGGVALLKYQGLVIGEIARDPRDEQHASHPELRRAFHVQAYTIEREWDAPETIERVPHYDITIGGRTRRLWSVERYEKLIKDTS